MAGYEVVLDDIRTLSETFDREAGALGDLKSKTNQGAPDTGEGDLTGTLGDVLNNLSTLYQVLVDVIHGHADKLREVHNSYQTSEHDARDLYNQMQQAFKDK
jgi:hypothetical protein